MEDVVRLDSEKTIREVCNFYLLATAAPLVLLLVVLLLVVCIARWAPL